MSLSLSGPRGESRRPEPAQSPPQTPRGPYSTSWKVSEGTGKNSAPRTQRRASCPPSPPPTPPAASRQPRSPPQRAAHRKLGALLLGGSTPSALPVGGSGGPRRWGCDPRAAPRAAGALSERAEGRQVGCRYVVLEVPAEGPPGEARPGRGRASLLERRAGVAVRRPPWSAPRPALQSLTVRGREPRRRVRGPRPSRGPGLRDVGPRSPHLLPCAPASLSRS